MPKSSAPAKPDASKAIADRVIDADQTALITWYRGVRRDLPWRRDRDAYRIWISEVMLQQTTVAAVIPFYERFMAKFPRLETLAQAPLEDVLEAWAGLGYYSRARNLHRAAQALAATGFPKTAVELAELSGFGPYTSRAVASLAFDEKTGVLDGNVIRILCRRYGLSLEWWKPGARNELQVLADRLAQVETPADLNQGMMELGATICTPRSPACLLCPWNKSCVARKTNQIESLPLKRPRRAFEIWHWHPKIAIDAGRVWLVENDYAPFLRGHWMPPGRAVLLDAAPSEFVFRGGVTHHDIFVTAENSRSTSGTGRWFELEALKKSVPSSLIRRAIESAILAPSVRETRKARASKKGQETYVRP